MSSGRVLKGIVRLVGTVIIGLLCANWRSLLEGLRYLRHMLAWNPQAVHSLNKAGRFRSIQDLADRGNTARFQYLLSQLYEQGFSPTLIPVPNETVANLLIRFGDCGPYTLFVAHYDKSRETSSYQGAADNTAAVGTLLAAMHELSADRFVGPVAFLFTAAEERGLKGAYAFLTWAQANQFLMTQVINLDMLGRGRLASRPSALPGFYFWLPLVGDLVYDGRSLQRGRPYPQPDQELIAELQAIVGKHLVVYQRFSAFSDSNAFQAAGIPTVSLSSDDMFYLDQIWERDTDRVELLDERNLELAQRFIVSYAQRQH